MSKMIKIGLIAVGLLLLILVAHREMCMPQSVTLGGITYDIPDVGEDIWGENLTNYLVALSTQVLTRAGGIFTLTAPVDFGASHGFLAEYVSARPGVGDAVAASGLIRLKNSQTIGWRNTAQNGDLGLSVNASDELIFNNQAVLYGSLPAFNTLSPLTTKGDILVSDGVNNLRLPVGVDGRYLVADSAESAGLKYAAVFTSPLTTEGDMIVAGSGGSPERKTKAELIGSDTIPGFVGYRRSLTIELSTDSGNFSGGQLKISRVDDKVTISQGNSVTHSSSANPISQTGLIPLWARPEKPVTNLVYGDAFGLVLTRVNDNGTLILDYRKWDGTADDATTGISILGPMSYLTPN